MPYLVAYDVTAVVSSNGSASIGPVGQPQPVDGVIGEYTEVLVSNVAEGDTVTAKLGNRKLMCPENFVYPVVAFPKEQCTGSGSNTPVWAATFKTCPVGFNP
jgi:hypothetical protein